MVTMPARQGLFQDLNFVRPIGHDAEEDKILVADRFIRMRHTCRYVNDVVPGYLYLLISNPNAGLALKHVLFVLYPVCVKRHTAAGFNNESTHGEIRRIAWTNEDLRRRF